MSKSDDTYSELTERVISALESGTAPWVRPWRVLGSTSDRPANFATKKPYNGINVLSLWMDAQMLGYVRNDWMTYKQGTSIGATVRKGEHGSPIIFASPRMVEDKKKPGTLVCIGMTLKGYTVFNVAQFDELVLPEMAAPEPFETIENAEAFISAQGATITHRGDSAFYSPSRDAITLPVPSQFSDAGSYYATSVHEHAHRTGHESRLDRLKKTMRFGDNAYAYEELIAELSAAFVSADLGLPGKLQHPEYLVHWAKTLKDAPKALMSAAGDAQKAVTYMNAFAYPDVAQVSEEVAA